MLRQKERYSNYHIIKYEDLVSNTLETITKIYGFADLKINKVKKFRLVVKKGGYRESHTGGHVEKDGELVWYPPEEFEDFISPKYNKNQISSLSDKKKNEFLSLAQYCKEYFGYK